MPPVTDHATAAELFAANRDLALRTAAAIGQRLPRGALHRGELDCAALWGLWLAARRYEPDRGFAFATYALRRIRGECLHWLRQVDYLGRKARRTAKREGRAVRLLSLSALADRTDPRATAAGKRREQRDALAALRRALTWRQRVALRLYYDEGWRMVAIGAALGITESGACRLCFDAVASLRRAASAHGLEWADLC